MRYLSANPVLSPSVSVLASYFRSNKKLIWTNIIPIAFAGIVYCIYLVSLRSSKKNLFITNHKPAYRPYFAVATRRNSRQALNH
jgi:hypothetical protein